MPEEFKPELLVRFDGGANTADFVDNIAKNQSPNPRGVDLIGKTIRKALGYTIVGTEPDASSIGYTLYKHQILSSTELLIKTIGTTAKFLDTVTNTWYPFTSATLTANKRWGFASFNGYLYGGNGTDNFCRWRASAYSTLNGAILTGATTIDLAAGTGSRFPNSGSGLIEGDTFSWTGRSTDQLTGVTGVSSGHASGSTVVIQMDTTTYSTAPKGSIVIFFKNRIFVRDDANPNFYYYTKLADNTNPEDDLANFSIAGSGTGDAGFMILPAPILAARVFISGANEALHLVACADGILYSIAVVDSGSTTVATTTPFKVLGADVISKRSMAVTENDMVVLDNFGNIRAIGYGDQSTTVKTNRLSDDISPTMESITFDDAVMEYQNRRLYAIGKQNGSLSNNFTVVRETNPPGFVFYDHWQFNDLAEANNILYGLSSLTGNVYRVNNGYSADGNPIACSFPVAGIDNGKPLVLKQMLKIRLSGYITNNCQLYAKIYMDESNTPYSFLISGDSADITSALENVAIGTVVFGTGVGGGGLPDGVERKKFVATVTLPSLDYYYVATVLFDNNQADVDFALDKMLVFASVADPNLEKTDLRVLQAS